MIFPFKLQSGNNNLSHKLTDNKQYEPNYGL